MAHRLQPSTSTTLERIDEHISGHHAGGHSISCYSTNNISVKSGISKLNEAKKSNDDVGGGGGGGVNGGASGVKLIHKNAEVEKWLNHVSAEPVEEKRTMFSAANFRDAASAVAKSATEGANSDAVRPSVSSSSPEDETPSPTTLPRDSISSGVISSDSNTVEHPALARQWFARQSPPRDESTRPTLPRETPPRESPSRDSPSRSSPSRNSPPPEEFFPSLTQRRQRPGLKLDIEERAKLRVPWRRQLTPLSACVRVKRVATAEEAGAIMERLKRRSLERSSLTSATEVQSASQKSQDVVDGAENRRRVNEDSPGSPAPPISTAPFTTGRGLADIAGFFVERKRELMTGPASDAETLEETGGFFVDGKSGAASAAPLITLQRATPAPLTPSLSAPGPKENPFEFLLPETSLFSWTTQATHEMALEGRETTKAEGALSLEFVRGVVFGTVVAIAFRIIGNLF